MSHTTFLPDDLALEKLLQRAGVETASKGARTPSTPPVRTSSARRPSRTPPIPFHAGQRRASEAPPPFAAPAAGLSIDPPALEAPPRVTQPWPSDRPPARRSDRPRGSSAPTETSPASQIAPPPSPQPPRMAPPSSLPLPAPLPRLAASPVTAFSPKGSGAPRPHVAVGPNSMPPEPVLGSVEGRAAAFLGWLRDRTGAEAAFVADSEGLPLASEGADELLIAYTAALVTARRDVGRVAGQAPDLGLAVELRGGRMLRVAWADLGDETFCLGWVVPSVFESEDYERLSRLLRRVIREGALPTRGSEPAPRNDLTPYPPPTGGARASDVPERP